MYHSIILSACLFGSVYICSTSLQSINMSFLENKKIQNNFIIINGLTFIISGSVFFYVTRRLTSFSCSTFTLTSS